MCFNSPWGFKVRLHIEQTHRANGSISGKNPYKELSDFGRVIIFPFWEKGVEAWTDIDIAGFVHLKFFFDENTFYYEDWTIPTMYINVSFILNI